MNMKQGNHLWSLSKQPTVPQLRPFSIRPIVVELVNDEITTVVWAGSPNTFQHQTVWSSSWLWSVFFKKFDCHDDTRSYDFLPPVTWTCFGGRCGDFGGSGGECFSRPQQFFELGINGCFHTQHGTLFHWISLSRLAQVVFDQVKIKNCQERKIVENLFSKTDSWTVAKVKNRNR